MNHLPNSPEKLEEYIRDNHLVYTDLRYSFAKPNEVVDVLEIDSDSDFNDNARRLLLVLEKEDDVSADFWKTADSLSEKYITPKLVEQLDGGVKVYQIPSSSRPFILEASLSEVAKNDMDNDAIAKSLGRLMASHYQRTGTLISPEDVRSRLMIIDFQGSDVQPIMLAPTLSVQPALQTMSTVYGDVFLSDFSSQKMLNESFGEKIE